MLSLPDARPVAVARIGLGLATVFNAFEMFHLLGNIASGMIAVPVASWLPGPTSWAVSVYLLSAVAAGAAITVGFHVKTAAVLSTLLSGWVFLWDQQTYSSHRWLAFILVGLLIFAKSDAVWAVRPRPSTEVPWWPQFLMMTQISVVYFFAAASKVNLLFLSGVALSGWVWVRLPWWLFTTMAIGTVITEFFLAIALWSARHRHFAVAMGLGLHGSIVLLIADQTWALIAFSLTCVSIYGLFLTRPALRRPITDLAPLGQPATP